MNVEIKVIPHKSQRYETVGDWYFSFGVVNAKKVKKNLEIKVSDMKNWKYEMLVAVHELVEFLLCEDRGIIQKDCDRFDMKFEADRLKGKHSATAEPGRSKKAPYYREHKFASKIEKLLAEELNVNWKKYDDCVNEL